MARLWLAVSQTTRFCSTVCNYLRQRGYVIVVVCLSVCLSVSNTLRKKTSEPICMKFSGKAGNGLVNKRLNFGGDPVTDPNQYRDTGKMCLGGGMHCPSELAIRGKGLTRLSICWVWCERTRLWCCRRDIMNWLPTTRQTIGVISVASTVVHASTRPLGRIVDQRLLHQPSLTKRVDVV